MPPPLPSIYFCRSSGSPDAIRGEVGLREILDLLGALAEAANSQFTVSGRVTLFEMTSIKSGKAAVAKDAMGNARRQLACGMC